MRRESNGSACVLSVWLEELEAVENLGGGVFRKGGELMKSEGIALANFPPRLIRLTYQLEDPQVLPLQGGHRGHRWIARYSHAHDDYLASQPPSFLASPRFCSLEKAVKVLDGSMPSADWTTARRTMAPLRALEPILLLPEQQAVVVICVHGVPAEDLVLEQRDWEFDGRWTVYRMGVVLLACDSAP